MKTVLAVLILALACAAQSTPRVNDVDAFVKDMRLVGKSGGVLYFINFRKVERKDNVVSFYGFVYRDRENFLLSAMRIDCMGMVFQLTETWGKMGGDKVHRGKMSVQNIPHGSAIAAAHSRLCGFTS